jgi:hypothetical protein
MQKISKEYEEFLKEEFKHYTLYERACNFSQKIFPINPPKEFAKKIQEAVDFAHLNIKPKGAFSFAILATLLFFLVPLSLAFALKIFSISVVLLVLIIDFIVFYYMFYLPLYLATSFRIRASSEMILTIVYMTISMRITPNIENAVKFAAENLKGPLGTDLKKLLWDVYVRKYESVSQALDSFIAKWKMENEEFTEAIDLIKTSTAESPAKRERALDEAVSTVLTGTKERMKHYAQDLRTPVTVLNAMGILLPIVGLVFFPIIGIFLPDVIKPVFLAIGYNIFLPVGVFWLMKTSLEKRPYTFHQPDITAHPQFRKEKIFNKITLSSILLPLPVIGFALYRIIMSKELFSFDLLVSSLLITCAIAFGIVFYCIFSTIKKLKLREEVAEMESEFAEALFQLGNQLTRGMPIEHALRAITPRIKDLKISKMFEKILYNMESFGMTFEQAIFDEKSGAIHFYPSKIITASLKAIVEISKRGMEVVSKAMLSISVYLKDVHAVEEDLRDMLSEVTSTMEMQAVLLAPLASGVVVGLAAIIMQILTALKGAIEKIQGSLVSAGPAGLAGGGILTSIINVDKMIPVHGFQLIVGIYMIEVVSMLAIFLSIIKHGEEDLLRRYNLGKLLLLSTTIYSITLIVIYSMFTALMPVMGLMK